MQMFFVSPAISKSAKEDIAECLRHCLLQHLPSPIIELLTSVKQVATCSMLGDKSGHCQVHSHLQKAVSRTKHMEELADAGPAFLHYALAVVQYMKFYNCASAAEMGNMLVTIHDLLFPAVLTDARSLEELVALRSGYDLRQTCVPLLLDFGTLLLQCTSTTDLAELIFKIMGCQLPIDTDSTDILVSNCVSAVICFA